MNFRFMDASALRIGDLLMLEGNEVEVTKLTWGHGIVEINNAVKLNPSEVVSVSVSIQKR